MDKKIHVVSYYECGIQFLKNDWKWLNLENVDLEYTNNPEEADILIFTGGEDIDPSYYGHRSWGKFNYFNNQRDKYEIEIAKKYCLDGSKFSIGICRGAQLLTVVNGGHLIQHVSHHSGNHLVHSRFDNDFHITNSIHHQMCWPYDLPKENYEVICYSKKDYFKRNSFTYLTEDTNEYEFKGKKLLDILEFEEPEVIWYPKTKCFGVQGHPEMLGKENAFVMHLNKIINEKMNL